MQYFHPSIRGEGEGSSLKQGRNFELIGALGQIRPARSHADNNQHGQPVSVAGSKFPQLRRNKDLLVVSLEDGGVVQAAPGDRACQSGRRSLSGWQRPSSGVVADLFCGGHTVHSLC